MPSPFPGMDPYLEGYLWPDVHHTLATQIRDQLTPQLRPRYVARIEVQVVQDESPEAEIGIMYPDVEVMERSGWYSQELSQRERGGAAVAIAPDLTPSTLTIPLPEVRLASVQVRDTAQNELVASIEILSPVNKREPGLTRYRDKRARLHAAGVHLLEIDLLRRGVRPLAQRRLPATAYLVTLTRAQDNAAHVWAIALNDALPVIPVPLRHPDPDVRLDLNHALHAIYDRAAYDLSIDYSQAPPPPELTPAEEDFVKQALAGATSARQA